MFSSFVFQPFVQKFKGHIRDKIQEKVGRNILVFKSLFLVTEIKHH